MGLLSYRPSGDISDWMYIDKGIMSLSVEIGTEESFFPRVLPAIQDIEYSFLRSSP